MKTSAATCDEKVAIMTSLGFRCDSWYAIISSDDGWALIEQQTIICNNNNLCVVLMTTHYNVVIMSWMASQITSLTIVYTTVYSGADQRKHQSSASLAFVRGIHRWPVNSPHKWPVTRRIFPFDDVIMLRCLQWRLSWHNDIFTFSVMSSACIVP